jgi:ribosomal protein S8E
MPLYRTSYLFFTILAFLISGCAHTEKANGYRTEIITKDDFTLSDHAITQTGIPKRNDYIRIQELKLSYHFNEKPKEEIAKLKYNDNHNYSIYLLPNYRLTEETKLDTVYLNEDESIFMKIEVLPEDVDWTSLMETTSSKLATIFKKAPSKSFLNSETLEKSTILETNNDDTVITAYFINKKDIKLKLTMYTRKNADHRDAFFQMAKTIMRETLY